MLQGLEDRDYFRGRLEILCAGATTSRVSRDGAYWLTRERTQAGAHVFSVRRELSDPPQLLFGPDEVPLDQGVVREVSLVAERAMARLHHGSARPLAMELRIRDLETDWTYPSVFRVSRWGRPHWTADSSALIYSRLARPGIHEPDGIDRESLIGFHVLGTEPEEDVVLYKVDPWTWEPAPRPCSLRTVATLCSTITTSTKTASRSSTWAIRRPLTRTPNAWRSRVDARGANRYVGSVGETIFLLTTHDAPKGRIVAVDLEQPQTWRTVHPRIRGPTRTGTTRRRTPPRWPPPRCLQSRPHLRSRRTAASRGRPAGARIGVLLQRR